MAEKFGAMKAVPLAVAGAFHTKQMNPAAQKLAQALEQCEIRNPSSIKVIANIDAEYYKSSDSVRKGLTRQLIEPILWQKCMERLLAEGVQEFYEIGPGRVLTGLMKRINRKARVINISSAESLSGLASP